ncbi:vacuolar serine protease [Microthyrium microscopicum]|uniref:Vacuolar serine protease n=1 Tax=Microthyrium microscopicum TaxID=703497 RepID=A0A6A6UNJ1_9PEZI|nr:vacuolar serine protease [Microthyrium microscopicum]
MKVAAFSLTVLGLAAASPFKSHQVKENPVLSALNSKPIPNSYIVKFKNHVNHQDAKAHHDWVHALHIQTQNQRLELRKRSHIPIIGDVDFNGLKHTYNIANSFLGYSGHFDDQVLNQLRQHPDIEYIEQDSEVHSMLPADVSADKNATIEKGAPWGLARISHREGLSFGTFNKYLYAGDGGEGVDVYVIDTGTNTEHVDFEGRARWGKTIPSGDEDADGNGHGTHCSGTIAGKKYGVAKKANVVAVKVLRSNGSGSMSDVVKGVEFAVEAHGDAMAAAKAGKKKGFKGSAANMSLGGGKSPTLDMAVNAAVDAGIHFAVAAGNDNADACNYSPASAEKPVTVGASTLSDDRAYFSNFGKCTDIFAPGLNIQSTWIGSKYAINTISGTSMASPHIAGLLAYYLSLQPAKDSAYTVAEISPKDLKKTIISIGTKGVLADIPSGTPNVLAWNGGGSSNYSDIVGKGGYTLTKEAEIVKALPVDAEFEVPDVSEIKIIIEKAGSDVRRGGRNMEKKLERVVDEIEEFIHDEIKELLADF